MTRDALNRGAIPEVYAREVLRAVQEARRQQANQPEWAALPDSLRRDYQRSIQDLAFALGLSSGSVGVSP